MSPLDSATVSTPLIGGPALFLVIAGAVLLAYASLSRGHRPPPQLLQHGTVAIPVRRGLRSIVVLAVALHMAEGPGRPSWASMLGLLDRGPAAPVVGPKAYVRVWERVRAAIVLTVLVVLLGLATAAAIGAIFVVAGFLLEQIVS